MKPYDENAFIVESRQVKNVVRVTAVDPQTGIEATIVTPLRVSQRQREMLAVRKLRFVLEKRLGTTSLINEDETEPKPSDDHSNDIIT